MVVDGGAVSVEEDCNYDTAEALEQVARGVACDTRHLLLFLKEEV